MDDYTQRAGEILAQIGQKMRPKLKPVKEASRDLELSPERMKSLGERFEKNRRAVYQMMLLVMKQRGIKNRSV